MKTNHIMYHIADKNQDDKRISTYIDYLNHNSKKCRAECMDGKFIVWEYEAPDQPIIADHIEYIEGGLGRKWICKYDEKTGIFEHTAVEFQDKHTSYRIHYRHWSGNDYSCYIPTWYEQFQTPAASKDEYELQMKAIKAVDTHNNIAFFTEWSEEEETLDQMLSELRDEVMNHKYVMAIKPDSTNAPRYYPPIHPFYEAKRKLEEVKNSPEHKLFEVFSQMPKGGNLHIHTSATLSIEKLMELLKDFDGAKTEGHDWRVYVLTDNWNNKVKNTLYLTDGKEIENDHYKQFCQLTIEEKEDLRSDLCFMDDTKVKNTDYIWDAFSQAFNRIYTILGVRDFYYEYYVRAFQELIEDHVDYAELRFGIPALADNNNDAIEGKSPKNVDNSFKVIYDAYQKVKEKCSDFTLKLIVSGSRKKEPDYIKKEVTDVKKWIDDNRTGEYANFIIGYDLVGEEDRGNTTDSYAKALYESGCVGKVPFYFHDGESCWANDDNIYSALALGTKRIGHGLNLFRFPAVVDVMKTKGIALEVCPISNQILRYTTDLRMHPIGEYINRGIPCVICSDDPQILGNPGLSYDFWEIYLGQLLSLKEIKQLILNSYEYSGMTEDEKKIKIDAWKVKWDEFIKKINN